MFHVKHYFDAEQEKLFDGFLEQKNLNLTSEQKEKLYLFSEGVIAHNQITNLVSSNDAKKLLSRHIADSLIPLAYMQEAGILPSQGEWADMGAGAGFPCIPLCICLPQVQFYAVEPRKKRCEFLRSIQSELDLKNLTVVEDTFEKSDFYDLNVISCRALGSLEEDYKRAQAALASNGSFLTLKSRNSLVPMIEGKHPLLKKAKLYDYMLPQESQQYVLVHLRSHG